jgi:NADH:ubiquinone oxidoreductase subunit C
MTDIQTVLTGMRDVFGKKILEQRTLPLQEDVVEISAADIGEVVSWLLQHTDVYHVSAITGIDNGQQIELYYHFWCNQGISLYIRLPREEPVVPSITNLIPGASFYEREIYEMLGVQFTGLQQLPALLMPDDWNGRQFPLRTESKTQEKGRKE